MNTGGGVAPYGGRDPTHQGANGWCSSATSVTLHGTIQIRRSRTITMSILRICSLLALLLSTSGASGCQVLSPSAESKTIWRVNEPNSAAVLGDFSPSQIIQICMDDGFRTGARVMADRTRTYVLAPGNCIDVEASTLGVSVPCANDCARAPLGSGTVAVVHGVLPPRGAWSLGGGDSREIIHLINPRFYEFCNTGQQPVRLYSDYRITDRDVRQGACGAVRGRDIGVQSGPIGDGSSGAYRYVE